MWTSGHQDTVVSHSAHGRCPPHSLVQRPLGGRSQQPLHGRSAAGLGCLQAMQGMSAGVGEVARDISKSRIQVEERLTAEDVSAWGCTGSPAEWTPLKLSRDGEMLCACHVGNSGTHSRAHSASRVWAQGTEEGRTHAAASALAALGPESETTFVFKPYPFPVFPAVETVSPFATPASKCWRRKPRGPETAVCRVLPDEPLEAGEQRPLDLGTTRPAQGSSAGVGLTSGFLWGFPYFPNVLQLAKMILVI